MTNIHYVLANFGGPRHQKEVFPFLQALLTDQDVIQTKLPPFIHRFLFTRIAKKRTKKASEMYQIIGGKSPIYEGTEALANALQKLLHSYVSVFHRYLTETHQSFIDTLLQHPYKEIHILPLFPQFSYATTGSIARWLQEKLPSHIVSKICWVKSYPTHPVFIEAHQRHIKEFLKQHNLREQETLLLFSAHGIPQKYVDTGDPYENECNNSFESIRCAFPQALSVLCYQSRFGHRKWLKPYTIDVCQKISSLAEHRKHAVFVPLSFISENLETLYEIEKTYMPIIRSQGLNAYCMSALSSRKDSVFTFISIFENAPLCTNQMLIRKSKTLACDLFSSCARQEI